MTRLLCLLFGHNWVLLCRNWGDDDSEDYYPFWSEEYKCERCHKRKVVY